MTKNPKRVLAGRLNRQKRGELSDEARQRLREAALRNQPWQKSTGPRTPRGKRISSRNGRDRPKKAVRVDPIEEKTKLLLRTIRETRKQCHLDPHSGQLVTGENVAVDLAEIIFGANHELARGRAERLLQDCQTAVAPTAKCAARPSPVGSKNCAT